LAAERVDEPVVGGADRRCPDRHAGGHRLEVAEATTRRAENTAAVCRAHAVALAGAIDGLTDALTRVDELN
jgi:hypothetical protein